MYEWKLPLERFSQENFLVFFTGAGIAAESGIPTFRDVDGLWSKHDPYELASPDGFEANPELVLEWYLYRREKALNSEPNPGHRAITDFQKLFARSVVITQNVDGLHARAGNQDIIELHGNLNRYKCYKCGQALSPPVSVLAAECPCGGRARPDVVWFGESLLPQSLERSWEHSKQADIFFSIGTSTQIYPAAQLPFEAKRHGAFVIEINPQLTPLSPMADLSLQGPSGEILPQLFKEFHAALSN